MIVFVQRLKGNVIFLFYHIYELSYCRLRRSDWSNEISIRVQYQQNEVLSRLGELLRVRDQSGQLGLEAALPFPTVQHRNAVYCLPLHIRDNSSYNAINGQNRMSLYTRVYISYMLLYKTMKERFSSGKAACATLIFR